MEIEEAIKIIEANWPPEDYTMLRLALHKLIEERSKPMLTAGQREALSMAIRTWQKDVLSKMLSGSVPAWKVTEERIQAIRRCMSMKADFYDLSVIEAMLEEAGQQEAKRE